MEKKEISKKKDWTDEERLKLATKLDAQLDEYINSLEKKTYTEGWPEDRWQEEMEKHPFFMKHSPQPGEELSPLMEGLQQLKYGEDENTPEELANNYKQDGNFNYKYKKYRLAILSYTEGIKANCKNADTISQLYNNRAAANFMLKNYRCCLSDCKMALKYKPDYQKALHRAILCCLEIKDYDQCLELCDKFLTKWPSDTSVMKIKTQAVTDKKRLLRDKRMQDAVERKIDREEDKLINAIKDRKVKLDFPKNKDHIDLKYLVPQIPQLAQHRVHLDEENKLIWPVMFLYPENCQTDFIQNFHEDTVFVEQLQELFTEPVPEQFRHYKVDKLNVYFEGDNKKSIHKVNVNKTLKEILRDERFVIRGGTPAFIVLVSGSEAEKKFLSSY